MTTRRPLLRLSLYGLLLTLLSFSLSGFCTGNAANVTITNNIVISNAYGKLTAVGTMIEDSFATYTNGTVFFNVAASSTSQINYVFTAQSYGNGTFTVRFAGPQPGSIQTKGHSIAYSSSLKQQDVLYSGGDVGYGSTSVLIVSYINIGHVLRDAAFISALMTPIVLFVGLAKWAQDPFDPKRPEKMKRLYYVALTMSLVTALLFIMSQLFNV